MAEGFENTSLPELGGLTLAQLRQKEKDLEQLIAQIRGLFPIALTRYTEDDRAEAASYGSLRGGEKEALLSILDAAESSPGTVTHLADKDEGSDAAVFETGLLRVRLEAATTLYSMQEKLDKLSLELGDTGLSISVNAKPVVLAAYGVLKPAARSSDKIRNALATALDFFRKISRPKKIGTPDAIGGETPPR